MNCFCIDVSAPLLPLVAADPLQRLEHHDRVSADDLCEPLVSCSKFWVACVCLSVCLSTYHHAELDFLSAILLLDGLVQNDIQEDVVAAEDADDLAAAVELDKQPLVEVLQKKGVSMRASKRGTRGPRRE